jgi:hypothetical protein
VSRATISTLGAVVLCTAGVIAISPPAAAQYGTPDGCVSRRAQYFDPNIGRYRTRIWRECGPGGPRYVGPRNADGCVSRRATYFDPNVGRHRTRIWREC